MQSLDDEVFNTKSGESAALLVHSDSRLNRFTNNSTQNEQILSKDEASTFKQPPALSKQINNIHHENKIKVFSFLLAYVDKGFKFRTSWPERKEMLQNLKKFIDDFNVNSLVSGERKDKYKAFLNIPEDRETYPMIRLYTNHIGHKVLFHGQLLPSSNMNESEKISRGHSLFRVLEIELKYYFVNEIKTLSIPYRLYRGEYWDDRKLEHIQSISNESTIMKRFVKQYVPVFSSSAEETVAKRFISKQAPNSSLHKCLFQMEIIEIDATYLEKFRRVCPQCEIVMNVATDVSRISFFPAEKEFIILDGPMAIINCEKVQINSKDYCYKVHFQMINAKLQGVWYEPYQNLFKKICNYSLFAANKSNELYKNKSALFASQLDSYFEEFERCYNYLDYDMDDQDDSTRVSIARQRSWYKFAFYDFVFAKFPQQTDKNVDGKSLSCPQIYKQLKMKLNVMESKVKATSYRKVFEICDRLLDAIIAYFETEYDQNALLNSFYDNYSMISAQSSSPTALLNGRILTEVQQYLDSLPSYFGFNYHSLEKCQNEIVHIITSCQNDQTSVAGQSSVSSNVQPNDLIASLLSHICKLDTTKTSFFSNFEINKLIGAFIAILYKMKEKSSDNDESIQELFNRFNQVSTYLKAMPSIHFTNDEILSSFVNEDGITFLKLFTAAAKRVFGQSDVLIKQLETFVESLETFNKESVALSILHDEKLIDFWLLPLEQHLTYTNLMFSNSNVPSFLYNLTRTLFITLIVNLTSAAEELDLGQYSWIIGKKSDTVFSADDTFAMD